MSWLAASVTGLGSQFSQLPSSDTCSNLLPHLGSSALRHKSWIRRVSFLHTKSSLTDYISGCFWSQRCSPCSCIGLFLFWNILSIIVRCLEGCVLRSTFVYIFSMYELTSHLHWNLLIFIFIFKPNHGPLYFPHVLLVFLPQCPCSSPFQMVLPCVTLFKSY